MDWSLLVLYSIFHAYDKVNSGLQTKTFCKARLWMPLGPHPPSRAAPLFLTYSRIIIHRDVLMLFAFVVGFGIGVIALLWIWLQVTR